MTASVIGTPTNEPPGYRKGAVDCIGGGYSIAPLSVTKPTNMAKPTLTEESSPRPSHADANSTERDEEAAA